MGNHTELGLCMRMWVLRLRVPASGATRPCSIFACEVFIQETRTCCRAHAFGEHHSFLASGNRSLDQSQLARLQTDALAAMKQQSAAQSQLHSQDIRHGRWTYATSQGSPRSEHTRRSSTRRIEVRNSCPQSSCPQ